MLRKIPVVFSLLSLSFLLVGATCSPQAVRPKPKKFELRFSIAPALVGGSVQVDIIGASTRSYLPSLENISLGQYWSPDNVVRKDAPKSTIVFGKGSPREQTFPSNDQKWNSWLNAGAEVLVIMVDSPGKPDRKIVSIDEREWGSVATLEFLIQESGIQLITARPTK